MVRKVLAARRSTTRNGALEWPASFVFHANRNSGKTNFDFGSQAVRVLHLFVQYEQTRFMHKLHGEW